MASDRRTREDLLRNDRRDPRNRNFDQENQRKIVDLIDIRQHGEELIIPETMDLEAAAEAIMAKAREFRQEISFSERVNAAPWDGALALKKALTRKFGVAVQQPGFFSGARLIGVDTGVNETTSIPWGRFTVPGLEEGTVGCSATMHEGRWVFEVVADVKKRYENIVREIVALTREIVAQESIYQGKAVEVKFRNDKGELDQQFQPKFLDLSKTEQAIFSQRIELEIADNITTLIEYTEAVRQAGTPLKRGILLAGQFGVGKTLLARNIAMLAVRNGWTFIYVKSAEELSDALNFARDYGKVVVFVEDIDRVTHGERTPALDELSYELDGLSSKINETIVIMSTNAPERINKMITRAGRVDATIFLDKPDAEAVTRLIEGYGKGSIEPGTDLVEAGDVLAGQIPAVIREVVERAKLRALTRSRGGSALITGEDLIGTARSYLLTQERLNPPVEATLNYMEQFGTGFGKVIAERLAVEAAKYLGQAHFNPNQNGHIAEAKIPALAGGN